MASLKRSEKVGLQSDSRAHCLSGEGRTAQHMNIAPASCALIASKYGASSQLCQLLLLEAEAVSVR